MIGLAREGFDVTVARDGNEALATVRRAVTPTWCCSTSCCPRLSGIDVCRAIRARSSVPIIMVTAKGTEIDTVVGLEVGADDYVTKPYRLRELVARMRAVLRRTPPAAARGDARGVGPRPPSDGQRSSRSGAIRVDPDRHRVFVRGEEVHLRRKEFELLVLLIENAGRVLTRDTLIDRVWGADYVGRHQDPRRPHQAAADPRRSRPVLAQAHHHRPGRRLPVRRPALEPTAAGTAGSPGTG